MDEKLDEQLDSKDPRERAKAIKTMAFSGEEENLVILKDIHEFDPDPNIREFARRAALHLYQNLNEPEEGSPQLVEKEEYKPQAGELTSVTLDTTPRKKETEAVSRPDREKADKMVQRAFTLYSTDQTKKAIKVFTKALEINPGLEGQTFAANLAMELTGLPLETAFSSLRGEDWQKEVLESIQEPEKEKIRKPIRPLSVILLILAFAALGVVSSRFIKDGTFDRYRVLIASRLGGGNEHAAGGYKYLLLKPMGRAPEGGWPVVIALHGFGGQGSDMMGVASLFTREGIVYVAPSFGSYAPYPGSGPIESMLQILNDVNSQMPIDPDRVVLLGFSQGGTFAYRFSLYHPEWVGAVVTAGAPDLSAGKPTENMPYVFTWGELDGLQDMVLPAHVYPLVDQGYNNINYFIISGAGHEVTPYAIDTAIALTNQ
jgi:predicted esterase